LHHGRTPLSLYISIIKSMIEESFDKHLSNEVPSEGVSLKPALDA